MRIVLLAALFVAAACAAPSNPQPPEAPRAVPAPVPAVPTAYAIRGEERPNWGPGWRAVIEGDRLLLDSPTSAGWYALRLPAPSVAAARRTYRGHSLTLTVEPGACALAPYRSELPDRITLDWDAGTFEGCGGPRRPPPADLAGTHWELVRIGDDVAPGLRSPAATLGFAPTGWLFGTEACNDAGAPIRWRGGRFELAGEGGGTTSMGCGDAVGVAFGNRFWRLMRQAVSWRVEGERLLITFGDGSIAELRYLL